MQNKVHPETARLVQTLLRNVGYSISVDGAWGPQSIRTLKDFQRVMNFVQTGYPDASILASLSSQLDDTIWDEDVGVMFTTKRDMVLRKFFPSIGRKKRQIVIEIFEELERNKVIYELQTNQRQRNFLAQIIREVGPRFRLEESFIYSPKGLMATFSYFRRNPEDAYTLGYNKYVGKRADQPAIANRAYANRMGNGSVASGDGWHTRGRGLKQLTGTNNLKAFTSWNRKTFNERHNFVKTPEMLLLPKYAARSGAFFWVTNDLFIVADQGESGTVVDRITAEVNKYDSASGKRERRRNLERLKSI